MDHNLKKGNVLTFCRYFPPFYLESSAASRLPCEDNSGLVLMHRCINCKILCWNPGFIFMHQITDKQMLFSCH